MDQPIDDIINNFGTIAVEELLLRILKYSQKRINCRAGAAFLLDKATNRFELRSCTWKPINTTSGAMGERIATKACGTEKKYFFFSAEEGLEELGDGREPWRENFRVGIAVPISCFGRVESILCFYFDQPDAVRKKVDQGLSVKKETRIAELADDLQTSHLSHAVYRLQMHGIPGRIHAAGQATAKMKEKVSRLISNLQQILPDMGLTAPDLIHVQLVDFSREVIQTIQGISKHQKLHIASAHSLSSKDINAHIIKARNVEIIAGFDPQRFDKSVYEEYQHHHYTRMWIPLFPFQLNGYQEKLKNHLIRKMQWEPATTTNTMVSQTGRWLEQYRPPEEIVYGVLELGYIMESSEQLSLAPWSSDYAMSVMAAAYKLSTDLYRATLPGVMERIGRLLANGPVSCQVRFECQFPNHRRCEIRNYPIDPKQPVAIPSVRTAKTFAGKESEFVHVDFTPIQNQPTPLSQSYLKDIWRQNAAAAEGALKTAFGLYESAMAPYTLIEREKDPYNLGINIEDHVIFSIIADAALTNGAAWAAFSCCERSSKLEADGISKCKEFFPPMRWPRKKTDLPTDENIRKYAHDAAREHSPIYSSDPVFCCLPLKLTEESTGIMLLGFAAGFKFDAQKKLDLERKAVLWRHRLSLHRLITAERFSNLMLTLRGEVLKAKESAINGNSISDPLETFMHQMIRNLQNQLSIKGLLLSLFQPRDTGPSRLKLYCCQKNSSPINDEFFNIENFHLPKEFTTNESLIFSYHRSDLQPYKDLVSHLKRFSTNSTISSLARIVRDEKIQSRLIIPILTGNGKNGDLPYNYGNLHFLLKEKHFFQGSHKHRLNELGSLIGLTMSQVELIQEQKDYDKYIRRDDAQMRKFENCKTLHEIIDLFFRILHGGASGNQSDGLGLSEDAVIWTLSLGNRELVARAGRGRVFGNLTRNGRALDVIQFEEHPIFQWERERQHITVSRKHYPILRKKFKVFTFDLSNQKMKKDFPRLFQPYRHPGGPGWLISFFMVDYTDRIFGIIDLFRDTPFDSRKEKVVPDFFQRLSRRLSSAAEKVRHRRVRSITEKLYNDAKEYIQQSRINAVYQMLAKELKEIFNCRQCDLFVEYKGELLLYASTHEDTPKNGRERALHRIRTDKSHKEPLGTCIDTGQPIICHSCRNSGPGGHMSEKLQYFLDRTRQADCMLLPLPAYLSAGGEKSETNPVEGLVQLHCPRVKSSSDKRLAFQKNYQRFSEEDFRLAKNIVFPLRRIIKIVQLAEQQLWLINEVGHSLAQPLQMLRSHINQPIRALYKADLDYGTIREMINNINQGFEVLHESLTQSSYFTGTHGTEWEYCQVDLKQLIVDCCDFMAQTARNRNIRIDYSQLHWLPFIPLEKKWMRKAILNLLHNACKYSWSGRDVTVLLAECEGKVILKITNIGIGIPSADKERIFEAYFRSQVDDIRGPRPGMGIGLTIVKTAIEKVHQGKITLESLPLNSYIDDASTTTRNIANVPFETTFTVTIDRKVLTTLSHPKKK